MVYANDQWVLLPVRDLYDTQMMAMAVNAAKDMYEKGQQEMKDFNTLYGDFMTPITNDQEKYNNAVIDPIRNTINAIYAAGGDPLRSPEARALISRAINSIDRGKVAVWKLRAENAREWYKNMAALKLKQLYNEDFSNFLRENPQLWGENEIGVTSPTAYDDLNAHTTHWFDKVNRNAYLRTDKEGYDWYGVRPEDLNAVMDQNIPDFLNSDYGRYLLELAKRLLGPDASLADIINQVRKNIVSANKEMTLNPTREMSKERELQLRDFYDAKKAAREFNYNVQLAQLKGKNNNSNDEYDSAEGLFYKGLIHAGGADHLDDPNEAVTYATDNIIDNLLLTYRNAKQLYGSNDKKIIEHIMSSASIEESSGDLARYLTRPVSDKNSGSFYTIPGDDEKMYDAEYLSTRIYGLKAKDGVNFKQGSDGIKQGLLVTPTTKVSTLFFKDSDELYRVGLFWEVYVSDTDETGSPISGTARKKYMKLPGSRAATTNMPVPTKRVYRDKTNGLDKKYRPNINPEYKTKGLKNSGSRTVNKNIGVSTKENLSSVVDPETVRR